MRKWRYARKMSLKPFWNEQCETLVHALMLETRYA